MKHQGRQRVSCVLLWFVLAVGLPRLVYADDDCTIANKPTLERARCRLKRAKTFVDARYKSDFLCQTLLMVQQTSEQAASWIRAQLLNELERYAEAEQTLQARAEQSRETRKLAHDAGEKARGLPAISLAFPAVALSQLTARNSTTGKERVIYCSAVVNAPEFDVQWDAPDANQVEFSLPTGTWSLEATWRDGSIWKRDLRVGADGKREDFVFGGVELPLPKDVQASASVSTADDSYSLREDPKRATDHLKLYLATVPANLDYSLSIQAPGQRVDSNDRVRVKSGEVTNVPLPTLTPILAEVPPKVEPERPPANTPPTDQPVIKSTDPESGSVEKSASNTENEGTWLGSSRPLWFIGTASGLALIGAGVITWAVADSKTSSLEKECSAPGSCQGDYEDRRSTVKTLDALWPGFLIAGIAGTVVFTTLAYWPVEKDESGHVSLQCTLLQCSVTKRWSF